MCAFKCSNYQQYVNLLPQDAKASLETAMRQNQAKLDLLLDPNSPDLQIQINPKLNLKDKQAIGISQTIETHINTNFLEPLIQQLEDNREEIKAAGHQDIDAKIRSLKQQQMKLLNSIRATTNQNPLDFNLLKGKVIAPIGDNQRSFQFDSAYELEKITTSIAETVLKENHSLPLVIRVTSPRDPESAQQPPVKDYVDKILLGAAKAGIRPDQVQIFVDGTPQATDQKGLGNDARYNQFVQTAKDVMETKTSSQTYTVRP